jgi:hypothetical protein
MKKIILLIAVLASGAIQAAQPAGFNTKITFLNSYNQYGNGDVIFNVDAPVAGCESGFWLTKADAGFQSNMAMLVAANMAKSTVSVVGDTAQMWGGSGGRYCKLYSIEVR